MKIHAVLRQLRFSWFQNKACKVEQKIVKYYEKHNNSHLYFNPDRAIIAPPIQYHKVTPTSPFLWASLIKEVLQPNDIKQIVIETPSPVSLAIGLTLALQGKRWPQVHFIGQQARLQIFMTSILLFLYDWSQRKTKRKIVLREEEPTFFPITFGNQITLHDQKSKILFIIELGGFYDIRDYETRSILKIVKPSQHFIINLPHYTTTKWKREITKFGVLGKLAMDLNLKQKKYLQDGKRGILFFK